ncbi:MAG: DUF3604 domain-containing protein [Clostridia bacterium]|nr:DUF3604 domain-containing protein [Clostridia bacterium]
MSETRSPIFYYLNQKGETAKIEARMMPMGKSYHVDILDSGWTRHAGDIRDCVSRGGHIAAVEQISRGITRLWYICGDRQLPLAEEGKFSHPAIAVDEKQVYVACESREEGKNHILILQISTDRNEITKLSLDCGDREYRPALAVGEGCLLLLTEAFYGGHYHILARTLREGSFTAPHEIGYADSPEDGNDHAPAAEWDGEAFLVSFESNRRLSKGYIMPELPELIIPTEGHGWAIEGRVFTRRLRPGEGISVTPLAELPLDTASAGVTSLFRTDFGMVLALYEFHRGYRPNLYLETADGWQKLGEGEHTPHRLPVSLFAKGSELYYSYLGDKGCVEGVLSLPGCSPTANDCEYQTIVPVSLPPVSDAQPEQITVGDKAFNIYIGDLHMHTNVSPCSMHPFTHCYEPEDKYRVARDYVGLDFALINDHDHMTDTDWERIRYAADLAYEPEHFVCFPGFEWTSQSLDPYYGHMNLLYLDDGDLHRCTYHDGERWVGYTPTQLWEAIGDHPVLTTPHHTSALTQDYNFDYYNPACQRLIEIFNVGGSYEYDDCEWYPPNFGRKTRRGNCVDEAFRRGWKVGFTSGGEHEGCGVTAVLAENLTREAIFKALYDRHTFAMTHTGFIVDFRIGNNRETAIMGDELKAAEPLTLTCRIKAERGIDCVRLMKNSKPYREWSVGGDSAFEASLPLDASPSYYYLFVRDSTGELCWSSPIWIEHE